MKNKTCSSEAWVLSELSTEQPDRAAVEHIGKCPVCRDSSLVHRYMGRLRDAISDMGVRPGIPDFESIWGRVRAIPEIKPELEKRAMLPLLVPRLVTGLFLILGIVFLMTARTDRIKTFVYSDLKIEVLYNILLLLGKQILALLPYVALPLGSLLIFTIGYFLYSLFHPRKA